MGCSDTVLDMVGREEVMSKRDNAERSKQEEIRDGIKEKIRSIGSRYDRLPWQYRADQERWFNEEIDDFIFYLYSNGIVLRVDRKLPDCDFCHGKGKATFAGTSGCMQTYESSCLKCNGTGKDYTSYVAVEPLIEDEKETQD